LSVPLVLLPGLNCSAELWSALDVGLAITPILTERSLDGQVDRLLAELPPRFDLAGLSLGGIVAMALVRRAPERVERLCLMSTTSRPPTSDQYTVWARQRGALAAGATARDIQRELTAVLLSPAILAARPDVVELTLAMADTVGAAVLDAQLELQASRVDERLGLANVRCPTTVIAASDDALCSLEKHQEIHRLVSGSELVIIAQCGHLSPLEQPDHVQRALNRWLAGRDEAS
jgi:pimeloyl-ACP methyl ester carboxylesterase